MQIRPKLLLGLWLLGFLVSLVIQSVLQGWFAEITLWGRNAGWQTEIAIWNAGMALVLVGLLRQTETVQAVALPGLAVLSLALGVNHLQTAIDHPGYVGHWLGAGANFTAVLLAALYFASRRPTPKKRAA